MQATVERLTINSHPTEEELELAEVGDYTAVVKKGQFKTGDYGVYIPKHTIVPDWLAEQMGLTDNCLEEGLIYDGVQDIPCINGLEVIRQLPPESYERIRLLRVSEGSDVTEFLRLKDGK